MARAPAAGSVPADSALASRPAASLAHWLSPSAPAGIFGGTRATLAGADDGLQRSVSSTADLGAPGKVGQAHVKALRRPFVLYGGVSCNTGLHLVAFIRAVTA